jgi:hypothetical protein
LKDTIEEEVNPVPVSVRTKGDPPTVALAGFKFPIVGCEFAANTGSVTGDDVPPPGFPAPPRGLLIERLIELGVATSGAGIVAVT